MLRMYTAHAENDRMDRRASQHVLRGLQNSNQL